MKLLRAICPHCTAEIQHTRAEAGHVKRCPICELDCLLPRRNRPGFWLAGAFICGLLIATAIYSVSEWMANPRPIAEGVAALLVIIAFILMVAVYFTPTFLAAFSRHRNIAGIATLNILLGWTLLGWVGALIWAIYREKQDEPARPHRNS